jgi:hypothetical protein
MGRDAISDALYKALDRLKELDLAVIQMSSFNCIL